MRPFSLNLIAFIVVISVFGQSKDPVFTRIHSNEIAANMHLDGYMFTDIQYRGFAVPYKNPLSPSSIYFAYLLFGGKDKDSNLLFAGNSIGINYITGPLYNEKYIPSNDQIQNFNKIWSVNRDDILAHIKDFNDNGKINLKLTAIYSWPGKSNPYFQAYNQFLPYQIDYDLAPFYDNNKDGIYNPDNGDYPIVPTIDKTIVPASIHWGIFHNITDKLRLEIGLTCWEMECNDASILNRSFFSSYKISNKCSFEIKESIVSIHSDIDLGCYNDDFIGCIPSKNASYCYNADEIDGNISNECDRGEITYEGNPPVQSIVFLNRKMDVIITNYNKTYPGTSRGLYNFINGTFGNTDILTNPKTNLPTKYEFSDNPSDPDGWSMYALKLNNADVRVYNSSILGNMLPNESKTLDIAYVFHHHPDSNFLQNVNLAYSQISEVQNAYNSGFINSCKYQTCSNDCVWPGDTDLDGIVDYLDLVNIFKTIGQSDKTRPESWVWKAHESQDWSKSLPSGINFKHFDLNGNGTVNLSDLDIFTHNFGKQHGSYIKRIDNCNTGNDFTWITKKSDSLKSVLTFNLTYISKIKNCQGISFEIKTDQDIVNLISSSKSSLWKDINLSPYDYSFNFPLNSNSPEKIQKIIFTNTGKNETTYDSVNWLVAIIRNKTSTTKSFFDLEVCNAKLYFEDGSTLPLGSRKQRIYLSPNAVHNIEDAEVPIIFPNPADGSVLISNIEDVKSIQLFTLQGVLIDQDNFIFQDKVLDTSRLEEGTYILLIKGAHKNYHKKLVIHH
ncbi:MAG: T9SS type A sorting domain-containing protein [Saprospiraceae bacterium]